MFLAKYQNNICKCKQYLWTLRNSFFFNKPIVDRKREQLRLHPVGQELELFWIGIDSDPALGAMKPRDGPQIKIEGSLRIFSVFWKIV